MMRHLGWMSIASACWGAAACVLVSCTTGGVDLSLPDAHFDPVTPGDGSIPEEDAGEEFPLPVDDACTDETRDSTLGEPCASDEQCDDGCYCNGEEACGEDSTCVTGEIPCGDDVECTVHACVEETDECFVDRNHAMCSDSDACNGSEMCDPSMGCVTVAPLYCNDEDSCTVDSCDPATGCVHIVRDLDGDSHTDGRCGGDDCDDDPRFGMNIYPGADEDCGNRRDDDCDGLRDYSDTVSCVPTNDTCASAQTLSGEGTFSGSTASLTANYPLDCMASGPDAVFRITVDPNAQFPGMGYSALDTRVSIAGGGSSVAVALREWDDGDGCSMGDELKCGTGTGASVLARSLPAGDYAVIVKTSSGVPFDLVISYDAPTTVPPVDICNAMTEDILTGGAFTGEFPDVEDDYSLSCHTSTGWRDAVYSFTIDEMQDVTLTASTMSTGFTTTYLALVRDDGMPSVGADCGSAASEVACVASSSAEIRRRELEAGTYFVILESSRTDATGWTLNVSITDPVPRVSGDACSTAVSISETTLGGGGSGTVALSSMTFDTGTSCGGTSTFYRDANFTFTLTETRDVTLTTTAPSFHYVSLGTECGVFAEDLRCGSSSGSFVQTFRSLPAGAYYVTTATSSTTGNVTASIVTSAATPIPPNDRCSGATNISTSGTYDGTTIDFEDDIVGCSGTSRPDAFYTFTLTERSITTVVVSRVSGPTGSFTVTLRANCTATENLACDTGTPAVFTQVLDPGTYTVIVETTTSLEGDFRIQTLISPE